ncbi:MAG: putative glycosyltransferase EpsF [Phycisphaerales bacterium]|nr:putative glycosyltransferase EpsF [Phycisphaerales bacterium]
MGKRVRIVHVINSFAFGGAEAMLCNLLLRTDFDRFEPTVVALIDDMSVAGPVLEAGIPLVTIGMRPGIPDPRGVARLAFHLRRARPAVVQTWMDHSNLIGGLATRLATRAKVVWGIHHSNHLPGITKRSTLMTVNACARLSRRVPTRIVCCSEHAGKLYAERGFDRDRLMIIPNGFNTGAFRPDPSARIGVRNELGLGAGATLVGLVARYDPFKDHGNFLGAAAVVKQKFPDARFLLCGGNVDRNNAELMAKIESLGLAAHCHLLGPRKDVARIHAALDVCVSSSVSEAFPLVVGEAMSCGTPCAVTDVGDSALIVGKTGRVVPPGDSAALGAAVIDLIALGPEGRTRLGIDARRRVRELFDLGAVTRRYEALYTELAGDAADPDAAATGTDDVEQEGVEEEGVGAASAVRG